MVSLLLSRVFPVPRLPSPTGPFSVVGFRDIDAGIDPAQGLSRLRYRVFYPSDTAPLVPSKYSPWAMHPRTFEGYAFFSRVPALLFRHLSQWKIPAVRNAPIHSLTNAFPHFPVYMYSHGLGGTPEVYSSHAIDLASHGFIVCLPHHLDKSAAWRLDEQGEFELFWRLSPSEVESNGPEIRRNQVCHRSKELIAAYEHLIDSPGFCSHINRSQGYFVGGHSFGGATAMETAQHDPRIIAAAIADIWMHPLGDDKAENKVPLVWLDLQSDQWVAWKSNWNDSRRMNPTLTVTVEGSRHGNFSDFSLISNPILRHLGVIGKADPLKILVDYHKSVRDFFSSKL